MPCLSPALLLTIIAAAPQSQPVYEAPFSDFRIGASLSIGGNASEIQAPVNAGLNLAFHVPLLNNLGLRASLSLLSMNNLDTLESNTGLLLSGGVGLDYTIALTNSQLHGLGVAVGAEYVFLKHLETSGSIGEIGHTGVLGYGELAYRRAMRVGVWAFGLRAETLANDPSQLFAVSAFFRFNFRF